MLPMRPSPVHLAASIPAFAAGGILIWAAPESWATADNVPFDLDTLQSLAQQILAQQPLDSALSEFPFPEAESRTGLESDEGRFTLAFGVIAVVGAVIELVSRMDARLKGFVGLGPVLGLIAGFIAVTAAAPVLANADDFLGLVTEASTDQGTIATLAAGSTLLLTQLVLIWNSNGLNTDVSLFDLGRLRLILQFGKRS
jgi:hypothetical protein